MSKVECFMVEPTDRKQKRTVKFDGRDPFEVKDTIWRALDGRWEGAIQDAPPGAMYDTTWMKDVRVGPDGLSLTVKLPNGVGEWWIDGTSSRERAEYGNLKDGKGWTRTGTAPKITVRPSIECRGGPGMKGYYHGWLTDGFLVEI